MRDLLIIVPSRGRPQNIAALHDAWEETSTGAAALLVAADDDDPTLPEYRTVCRDRGIELTVGPRLRMVPTLNAVAIERAPHHFALGFMGDDHRPRTLGWSAHYLAALRTLGTGFVYGNDLLAGERLPTQIAMTSDIVQALGAMVPALVKHLWADNQWWDLGHAIDRIRYLPDVVVEHMHPLAGKVNYDAGYREVNSDTAAQKDREVYAHWYESQRATDVAKLRALIEQAA
ncbi:hypothetical protein BJF79_03750 [Actinomadura sp. CNU-125]|uniref:hypothetical protein n=1 Tax=Actinomadura sp. CNU-125 TaxID=1904961 RepID=UPI0009611D94|nr:hypothetical protein [Actinomadura sp. CNU-125]OLT13024.1 hypothetical protein BJF79_03750 [Actinomadura sp. CNU-125]